MRYVLLMRSPEQIRREILALPEEQRADLALALLESLHDRNDDAYDEAWGLEIARRLEALDAGTMTRSPAHEVFARARARLAAGG